MTKKQAHLHLSIFISLIFVVCIIAFTVEGIMKFWHTINLVLIGSTTFGAFIWKGKNALNKYILKNSEINTSSVCERDVNAFMRGEVLNSLGESNSLIQNCINEAVDRIDKGLIHDIDRFTVDTKVGNMIYSFWIANGKGSCKPYKIADKEENTVFKEGDLKRFNFTKEQAEKVYNIKKYTFN